MAPSIFDYMEVQHFLQDVYLFNKKRDKNFSYAFWAHKLGFSNKTLLRLILQGQRKISLTSRKAFKDFLKLEGLESEYFDALIDYSQAPSSSQKQALGTRLLQLQRRNFVQPEISAELSVVKDVYGPLLLTLISSTEEPFTLQDLQIQLGLEKERLILILKSLEQDGLIQSQDTKFVATHATFKVADTPGHQALRNYYQHWIQKSAEAIHLPFAERRFRSLQILLSEEEFADLNRSFQEFVLANLSRFQHNTTRDRRLYLLNSTLFPVTKTL